MVSLGALGPAVCSPMSLLSGTAPGTVCGFGSCKSGETFFPFLSGK